MATTQMPEEIMHHLRLQTRFVQDLLCDGGVSPPSNVALGVLVAHTLGVIQ